MGESNLESIVKKMLGKCITARVRLYHIIDFMLNRWTWLLILNDLAGVKKLDIIGKCFTTLRLSAGINLDHLLVVLCLICDLW